MKCEQVQELFSDYIEGMADRALAVSLENHLNACASCREQMAGVRSLWGELDRMPVVETPAFFHENLMSRLHAEADQQEEKAARRRRWFDFSALFQQRTLAYGAAVLVLALLGTTFAAQQAGLNLFGWMLPASQAVAPQWETAQAEWIPSGNGAEGTLVVHLKTRATTSSSSSFTYRVEAEGNKMETGGVAPNATDSTVCRMTLASLPNEKTVKVSLWSGEGKKLAEKSIPITVQSQGAAPAPTP